MPPFPPDTRKTVSRFTALRRRAGHGGDRSHLQPADLTPVSRWDTLAAVHVRNSSVVGWVALGAVISGVTSCAWIGGIEEISLVTDAGSNDGAPDSAPTCTLPDEGEAFLRAGNVIPSTKSYDLCVKPAAAGSFDEVQPLFASGGSGCPAGLAYKELTVPFRVEPGTYDVRIVAAGAQDCSASLGEAAGIEAFDNRVNTVLVFEGEDGAPELRALPESQISFNSSQARFVHAIVDQGPLDCGMTDSSRLPAKMQATVFDSVSYGTTSDVGSSVIGSIDENGYLIYSFQGGLARFGIAEPGEEDALVTLATRFALNSSHTLFAVGRKGDEAFPPALWSCNEGAGDGVLATCGSPMDLSVEVFSAQLTDLYTPLYRERIEPVIDAVSKSTADVICINEVRNPEVLEALVEASKDAFPYTITSDELIPLPSDLTDQNGEPPCPLHERSLLG